MNYATIAPPLGEFVCNPPLNSEAGNQIASDIWTRQRDTIAWHPEAAEAERDDATEVESRRFCPELPPGMTFANLDRRSKQQGFGIEVFIEPGTGKKSRAGYGQAPVAQQPAPRKKRHGTKLTHAQAIERMKKRCGPSTK